jgi:hypothetical protein
MRNTGAWFYAAAAFIVALSAQPAMPDSPSKTGWFPFRVVTFEPASAAANPSPVDLSYLNREIAGEQDRIGVRDGHFVNGKGERVRFFGTVLAPGVFDYYCDDPGKVQLLAAQLRRLGINLVRVWPPFVSDSALFNKEMRKLDLLVAALKKNGIYVNLTLQVNYGDFPGSTDSLNMRFWWSNRLDQFYPPFVRLQEDAIRRIFSRKSTVTGLTYAEDPAIFCVALNNENSIFPKSGLDQDLADIGEPYRGELARQWNAWLKTKYGSTVRLSAFLEKRFGGSRRELLKDVNSGSSQHGLGWNVIRIDGTDVTSISTAKGQPGGAFVRWDAARPGLPGWQYSLIQTGLDCSEGKSFTISFDARIDPSDPSDRCPLAANAQADTGDYHLIGPTGSFTLSREWATYTHVFEATGAIAGHAQFSLNLGRPGIVDIRNASLRGTEYVLPRGSSLESGNFELPDQGKPDGQVWRADFLDFLSDTEIATARRLAAALGELHAKALVFNAQSDFGGYYGMLRESAVSDLIDLHVYMDDLSWGDPSNPGSEGWWIPNVSQIPFRSGASGLTRVALSRNAALPFTLSEYNMPAPDDCAAEMDPMMSTFASFQDWDAIYSFCYCDAGDNLAPSPYRRGDLFRNTDRIADFYANGSHPGKRVFMPSAALVFRLGLVESGRVPVTFELPRALKSARFGLNAPQYYWNSALGGSAQTIAGARRLQLRLAEGGQAPRLSEKPVLGDASPSDTGEILWDAPGKAYSVNAPCVRVASGAVSGKTVKLGDVVIEVGRMEQPFATIEIVAMDAKPISGSRKLLISAAARVENEGWEWDAERHYISNWAQVNDAAGTRTVAEPVPFAIDLPGTEWKVRALDGSGYPTGEIPTARTSTGTRVRVDSPRTLWYLAER